MHLDAVCTRPQLTSQLDTCPNNSIYFASHICARQTTANNCHHNCTPPTDSTQYFFASHIQREVSRLMRQIYRRFASKRYTTPPNTTINSNVRRTTARMTRFLAIITLSTFTAVHVNGRRTFYWVPASTCSQRTPPTCRWGTKCMPTRHRWKHIISRRWPSMVLTWKQPMPDAKAAYSTKAHTVDAFLGPQEQRFSYCKAKTAPNMLSRPQTACWTRQRPKGKDNPLPRRHQTEHLLRNIYAKGSTNFPKTPIKAWVPTIEVTPPLPSSD